MTKQRYHHNQPESRGKGKMAKYNIEPDNIEFGVANFTDNSYDTDLRYKTNWEAHQRLKYLESEEGKKMLKETGNKTEGWEVKELNWGKKRKNELDDKDTIKISIH